MLKKIIEIKFFTDPKKKIIYGEELNPKKIKNIKSKKKKRLK